MDNSVKISVEPVGQIGTKLPPAKLQLSIDVTKMVAPATLDIEQAASNPQNVHYDNGETYQDLLLPLTGSAAVFYNPDLKNFVAIPLGNVPAGWQFTEITGTSDQDFNWRPS